MSLKFSLLLSCRWTAPQLHCDCEEFKDHFVLLLLFLPTHMANSEFLEVKKLADVLFNPYRMSQYDLLFEIS